jgi:hypothetical protein
MHRNCRGYILLLMLLIVIVIGCIISIGGNPAVFFKKAVIIDSSGEVLPWGEKKRLVAKGKQVQLPSTVQPQLTAVMGYKAYPKEGDQDRGEIALIIDTDGRVRGNWSGDYRQGEDVSYAVLAGNFSGNIDPTNLYRDKSGTDPSKLYFFTKGSFMLLEENKKDNSNNRRQGDIYVTGWIDFNYKLTARIILTSDRTNYRTFTWECDQPAQGKDLLFMF